MPQTLDEIQLYAGHVPFAPQILQRLWIRLRVVVRAHHEQMYPRRRAMFGQPRWGALMGKGRVLLQKLTQVAGGRVRFWGEVSLEGSSRAEVFGRTQVQQCGAVAAGGPAHHAPAPAIRGDAQR